MPTLDELKIEFHSVAERIERLLPGDKPNMDKAKLFRRLTFLARRIQELVS